MVLRIEYHGGISTKGYRTPTAALKGKRDHFYAMSFNTLTTKPISPDDFHIVEYNRGTRTYERVDILSVNPKVFNI